MEIQTTLPTLDCPMCHIPDTLKRIKIADSIHAKNCWESTQEFVVALAPSIDIGFPSANALWNIEFPAKTVKRFLETETGNKWMDGYYDEIEAAIESAILRERLEKLGKLETYVTKFIARYNERV